MVPWKNYDWSTKTLIHSLPVRCDMTSPDFKRPSWLGNIRGAACAWCGGLLVAVLSGGGWADDPFDGAKDPKDGEAKADKADAGGGVGKEKDAKAKLEAERMLKSAEAQPALVRELRETNPATPEQLMQAAQIMAQTGQWKEAKDYLAQLIKASPEDRVMAALVHQLGPDLLLRFAREKELQPEGAQAVEMVFASTEEILRNPERIERLIKELSSPSLGLRRMARVDLRQVGAAAVQPLLNALLDATRSAEHVPVQAALVELAPVSQGPLLAALDAPDPRFQAQLFEILGRIHSPAVPPRLVGPATSASTPAIARAAARDSLQRLTGHSMSPADAERFLERRVRELLGQTLRPASNVEQVEVWQWDAEKKTAVRHQVLAADANLAEASRLASDLYSLAGGEGERLRLRLLTNLELAKTLGGVERPLAKSPIVDQATKAGAAVMSAVLADAMHDNRPIAAVAAAEVLGKIADPAALVDKSQKETPLVAALRHPDRRLRFTAAQAIVRIQPRETFPGVSRLAETLAYYSAATGVRRVLIGHPQAEQGQAIVGWLRDLGYEAEVAFTGKNLLRKAQENLDCDLVLISGALDGPPAVELIQQLRRDYRTARLPVGLLFFNPFTEPNENAAAEARRETVVRARSALRFQELEETFSGDPLTIVMNEIRDSATAGEHVTQLLRRAGRNAISPDEQVDQAAAALDGLKFLAEQPHGDALFEVWEHEADILRALETPGLGEKAAAVIGLLGSARCQTLLVDVASQNARPLALRKAAAAAFAVAVKRRGLLLTTKQLSEQYTRYNASEKLDAETQAVLGAVLDVMESRSRGATAGKK